MTWSLALCPTFHNLLLAGGTHPWLLLVPQLCKVLTPLLRCGLPKGTRRHRNAQGCKQICDRIGRFVLLCSKASDTFLSAPRRQANRGAGKTFVDLTEEGEQMLSPFEQHRLNNIAENERMLQQLGLVSGHGSLNVPDGRGRGRGRGRGHGHGCGRGRRDSTPNENRPVTRSLSSRMQTRSRTALPG